MAMYMKDTDINELDWLMIQMMIYLVVYQMEKESTFPQLKSMDIPMNSKIR